MLDAIKNLSSFNSESDRVHNGIALTWRAICTISLPRTVSSVVEFDFVLVIEELASTERSATRMFETSGKGLFSERQTQTQTREKRIRGYLRYVLRTVVRTFYFLLRTILRSSSDKTREGTLQV